MTQQNNMDPQAQQPTQDIQSPVQPPLQPPILLKSKHTKRVTLFLSIALIAAIGIFGLISMLVVRSPKTTSAEAKQQKYNKSFDQLSPSTSQVQPTRAQQLEEVSAAESVKIDDLDTNFKRVDTELNKL